MAAQDEVDVCESWEDMDEIGLDQKIRLMSSDCAPVQTSLKGCKVTVEENACIGSQCVMPEPAIRILKRPSSSGSGQLNGENRARPVKTLEQRQKEYAEARLRILGEARSPEDVIDDNLSRLQDKLQANNINDNQNSGKTKNSQSDNNAKGKERKVLTRLPSGATAAGVFPSPPPRGVLVIRTPRGPDGTKGFLKRKPLLSRSPLAEDCNVSPAGEKCCRLCYPKHPKVHRVDICTSKTHLHNTRLQNGLVQSGSVSMAALEHLSDRDKAVLRSIFDPTATIGDIVEDKDVDKFVEEDEEPTTDSYKAASTFCAQGVQLAEEGKLEEALEVLTKGVQAAPERAASYNDKAQLLRLMLRDDDAMLDLERALQLTTGKKTRARALALCQRGVLLRKRGADDGARADFAEAAKLGSSFAKKQVVELNPYAALCNQMLSQVMRGEKDVKL